MYTAVELNNESHAMLKILALNTIEALKHDGFQFKTPRGETLPHHMTINLGTLDSKLNDRDCLNKNAILKIDSIVWSESLGVCACPVTEAKYFSNNTWKELKTGNKQPHITVCSKENVPPKLSNKLLNETFQEKHIVKLDHTYTLEGVIKTL